VFSERECGGNWYKFLYRQNALLFVQIAVLKNFLKVTWSTDLNQGKSATVGHVLFAVALQHMKPSSKLLDTQL